MIGERPVQSASPGIDPSSKPRVRCAAHGSGATLDTLAIDPAVTVRAAVALNPAASERVNTVLARDPDERVRVLLAGKLARLVPTMPRNERNVLESLAYATLISLVADETVRVRAAIADVVKDMKDAPRDLIIRLAHDVAVAVHEPVIRLSPVLTAEDLIGLLAAPPSPEAVLAVAQRSGVSEDVADAIVENADTRAISGLLRNQDAAVREATLDVLAAACADNPDWHGALVRRPRLSARAATLLADVVATDLLAQLASRCDLDHAVTEELRRRLAERTGSTPPARMRDSSIREAMAHARALAEARRLDEACLLAAAQRGDARLCTAMLTVAAGMPLEAVERAVTLRSAKALVSIVWRAGFSMRVAGPVQTLLARLSPGSVLRGSLPGDFPLSIDEMRWQLDFLTRTPH